MNRLLETELMASLDYEKYDLYDEDYGRTSRRICVHTIGLVLGMRIQHNRLAKFRYQYEIDTPSTLLVRITCMKKAHYSYNNIHIYKLLYKQFINHNNPIQSLY